ncbi:MAG TPA: GTP diphosphokinase [Cellvibrionales bacterium]|jgi:GTP pyrophosphokinase|nr:GTP diphosphokinase [Cellvibrionales bacterium]
MVQVRKTYPKRENGSLDVDTWLASLPGFTDPDTTARMEVACQLASAAQSSTIIKGQRPHGLIGCFDAGLEMAGILGSLHMDEEVLIAAVIYRAVREERVAIDKVKSSLGSEVASLVQGVLRMAAISSLRTETEPVLGQGNAQVENIRKMLVAMVDDVRVGLIKLAERTQAIRAVKNHSDPEKQKRVAREVFEIYAPLAHRLGIGQIKWELEDVSFRYLEPEAYASIAKKLDGKRLDREGYIGEVIHLVESQLKAAGIDAVVSGRAKHIYSIWRKMQRKNLAFDQVYDIRALRIMVPQLKDCYASLGIIHTLWRNIPREFDDYIANPKDNGYRSLHTAVIGPEAKVLEVQIRTNDMHEASELGVCAHWLYKGTDTNGNNKSYEQKIEWLRQVLEWHEDTGGETDVSELASELTNDFGKDRIYVFTPEGHVVDVPYGSTPVDFAYHIHTEVGHRCRGAKVDGRIVPLSTVLRNGQKVEIITGPESTPNRDWLRASLGYLNSSRARSKARAWFKKQAREQNVQAGRVLLEREIKRLALTSVDYKILTKKLQYLTVDDLYGALGAGDVSTSQIMRIAENLFGKPAPPPVLVAKPSSKADRRQSKSDVTVLGVGNLLTQIAQCCKPVPGDDIAGYVTVSRGVTVHRKDCSHFLQVDSQQLERVIEVSWGAEKSGLYSVDIGIEAYDRTGLLSDVSGLLAAMRVNVMSVNTITDKDKHTADMRLTLEIHNIEELVRILARLNNMPNIINTERLS